MAPAGKIKSDGGARPMVAGKLVSIGGEWVTRAGKINSDGGARPMVAGKLVSIGGE